MKQLFYIGLLITILCSCNRNTVADRIIHKFDGKSAGDSCVVKLKDITDFKWERLYLFRSNIDADSISSVLGFTYTGSDLRGHRTLMIFTIGKKVIYEEDNDAYPINFGYQAKKLTPETALFEISKSKDKLETDSPGCFYYSVRLINNER